MISSVLANFLPHGSEVWEHVAIMQINDCTFRNLLNGRFLTFNLDVLLF